MVANLLSLPLTMFAAVISWQMVSHLLLALVLVFLQFFAVAAFALQFAVAAAVAKFVAAQDLDIPVISIALILKQFTFLNILNITHSLNNLLLL